MKTKQLGGRPRGRPTKQIRIYSADAELINSAAKANGTTAAELIAEYMGPVWDALGLAGGTTSPGRNMTKVPKGAKK